MSRANSLKRSIDSRTFSFVYQPIYEAKSREILGYEALCRPEDPVFSGPADLLETAEQEGSIEPLGRVLRELALEPVTQLAEPHALFINIHPQELFDPELAEPETFMQPWVSRVVLEVSPNEQVMGQEQFQNTLQMLKDLGFKIALDELMPGYLGLDQLVRLQPDFLKLQVGQLLQAETDQQAARINQHLMETAKGEGIPVIVCKIESGVQMQYALKIVCSYLQGRHLGNEAPPFAK
jgi:EAL domain-containing protein (putative c-di-GMP-specific phosphodiesterase class I)